MDISTGWGSDEATAELLEWNTYIRPGSQTGQGYLVRGGYSGKHKYNL